MKINTQCFSFTSYIGDMHYNLFKNEERKKIQKELKIWRRITFYWHIKYSKIKSDCNWHFLFKYVYFVCSKIYIL